MGHQVRNNQDMKDQMIHIQFLVANIQYLLFGVFWIYFQGIMHIIEQEKYCFEVAFCGDFPLIQVYRSEDTLPLPAFWDVITF